MSVRTFSCIIPAYNEAGRVGDVIRSVKDHPLVGEVIVVSDGSTDGTAQEARKFGAHVVIDLKENTGKGGAVFVGAQNARNSLLLLLDGDLVGLKSEHIDALIQPVLVDESVMTVGVVDTLQQVLPHIAGQRALKRELILRHPALAKSGFKFELLLNHYAKKNNYETKIVSLPGVKHLLKQEKYGLVHGSRMSYRMMRDIFGRSLRNIFQVALGAIGLWMYLS